MCVASRRSERWRLRDLRDRFAAVVRAPARLGYPPLQQYKITFLDRLNVGITVRDFDGPDDTAALAHAESLYATHTIEVTQAERVLAKSREHGGMILLSERSLVQSRLCGRIKAH